MKRKKSSIINLFYDVRRTTNGKRVSYLKVYPAKGDLKFVFIKK